MELEDYQKEFLKYGGSTDVVHQLMAISAIKFLAQIQAEMNQKDGC